MSDRIYFRDGARITEEMLNDSFGFLEEAAQRLMTSLGIRGIVHGLAVQPQPIADMSVVVQPGLAFDDLGQRIAVPEAQTVDVSQCADGIKTAVVMPEHERWGALCIRFDRRPGKPFLDKNNRVVATCAMESFRVVLRLGVEAPQGHADLPAHSPGDVRLCDVRFHHGQTSVGTEDIQVSRREPFRFTHARTIEADVPQTAHTRTAQSSVQDALNALEARLKAQSQALAILVDGEAWRALPDAQSVQEAFNAVDEALTKQATFLAQLVNGAAWRTLPAAGSVQAALDAVDEALGKQTQRLHDLQGALAALRVPAKREGARTAISLFAFDNVVQLPSLGPHQTWVAAFPAKVTKDDLPVFVTPAGDHRVLATPQPCGDGALRAAFTNVTPNPIAPTSFPFTIYVAEMA